MLLNGADTPPQGTTPTGADLLTEQNTKAAQGALMGAALLYTAGGKEMPEVLKVGLFVAGVVSILTNLNKISGKPGA